MCNGVVAEFLRATACNVTARLYAVSYEECKLYYYFVHQYLRQIPIDFVHATACTAIERFSFHNSVCFCLFVTRVDQLKSKMVQARITKSSLSAACKTLVSGSEKLFHKFERSHRQQMR